jgi:hypothetical protein
MKYSNKRFKLTLVLLVVCLFSGCGTYVPNIQEFYETPDDAAFLIDTIVKQVQCEIRTAVQLAILKDMTLLSLPTATWIFGKLYWRL